MVMDYKMGLGARLVPRDDFVRTFMKPVSKVWRLLCPEIIESVVATTTTTSTTFHAIKTQVCEGLFRQVICFPTSRIAVAKLLPLQLPTTCYKASAYECPPPRQYVW
jgi:hypothetical protein